MSPSSAEHANMAGLGIVDHGYHANNARYQDENLNWLSKAFNFSKQERESAENSTRNPHRFDRFPHITDSEIRNTLPPAFSIMSAAQEDAVAPYSKQSISKFSTIFASRFAEEIYQRTLASVSGKNYRTENAKLGFDYGSKALNNLAHAANKLYLKTEEKSTKTKLNGYANDFATFLNEFDKEPIKDHIRRATTLLE